MENMIRFPQPSKGHYKKKSGVRCLQNRSETARDQRWKVKNKNRAQNKDAIMGGNYDCCKKKLSSQLQILVGQYFSHLSSPNFEINLNSPNFADTLDILLLILMLSFCFQVVVFSFLGTVYPLQIRWKKAKICSNVISITSKLL